MKIVQYGRNWWSAYSYAHRYLAMGRTKTEAKQKGAAALTAMKDD